MKKKIQFLGTFIAIAIMAIVFFASEHKAAVGTGSFAFIALVAGLKKKGIAMTSEEEAVMKGMEDEINKAFDDQKKGLITPDQLKEALKNIVGEDGKPIDTAKIQKIADALDESKEGSLAAILKAHGAVITGLKETTTQGKRISLAEELKANAEALKGLAKGTSSKEITLKAVTERASIANNQQAYDLPDIGQLATRKLSAYDIFPKLTIGESNNNGVIRYYDWDEDTIARAAAAVAEKGTFPESTATFKKGSITIQKVGDTLPVTEEFFEDEAMFAAELGLFLQTNVALNIDNQIINGDGTSNTLTGLLASINAYTPAAAGITDASIYDLIVKVSESITTTGGAKYSPDFALMHITDINKMKLKKDANYNYVMPPFVSKDGSSVSTMLVIECNILTANTMVIGDRRFGRIYEKGGIELSRGLVNVQFTADEMTLKARKRLAFLIRAADKGGFKKVTDIDAALTTLAS